MTSQLWARCGQSLDHVHSRRQNGFSQEPELGLGYGSQEPFPLTGLTLPAISVLGEHRCMCMYTCVTVLVKLGTTRPVSAAACMTTSPPLLART